MSLNTADLYDEYENDLQVAEPIFRHFGGRSKFHGMIVTVRVFEDNSLVRERLKQSGHGRVLVVDGGGSLRCALLGDAMGKLAVASSWEGVLIYGCIRDIELVRALPIGIQALATSPRKSYKRGEGKGDIPVMFAGVTFTPGHHLYADLDGIVTASRSLESGATVLV
ncbi:MAG: ribonuclease E activity regulator RraA [Gammaproteobacteria bacterium]|nr:ribonuclease E activity regulator RraA [Gammaproteobacteria bacterium]